MKKALLIILMLLTINITGCTYLPTEQPAKPIQPDKSMEESQLQPDEVTSSEEILEQRISEDGILQFPNGTITLLAYEDEMNLEETLGMPLEVETIILENADTFNGSHQKTLTYQNTRLIFFSPSQDGQRFYLINIETEYEHVSTNRGINLGSTLEEMQLAYPEVIRSLDGSTGTDGRYEMLFEGNVYTYLYFFVEEGKINKIQLLHEFA